MLGGSFQQTFAIQKAKDMGYDVVLIDYLPDNPGQYLADKWYQESTTDINAVARIAEEEEVDGILAYASDPAALPAAIVANKSGLPTNPPSAVEILGVKHKFRAFQKENGLPSPSFVNFDAERDIGSIKNILRHLRFPILVKPTDSSGSKGVNIVNNMDELEDAIRKAREYSKNKVLIGEEFIEKGFPYLIGGDIFVEEGKIILMGEMACMREDHGKSLIPVGKRFPSGLSDAQRNIVRDALQKIIDLTGIINGEFNIEVILDKNNVPYVLEFGPRAGGNMIPIQLSDAFGVDLLEANIKAALNEKTHLYPKLPQGYRLTHVLHSDQDGIFEKVSFSPEIEPYIYRKVIYKKEGDPVEKFDGAGKAIGIIFFHFPDENIFKDFLKDIRKHIVISLKSPGNE